VLDVPTAPNGTTGSVGSTDVVVDLTAPFQWLNIASDSGGVPVLALIAADAGELLAPRIAITWNR
jgi:hypothetical protein